MIELAIGQDLGGIFGIAQERSPQHADQGGHRSRRTMLPPPIKQQHVARSTLFNHQVVDRLHVRYADFGADLLQFGVSLVDGPFPPTQDGEGGDGQSGTHLFQDANPFGSPDAIP